MTEPQKTDVQVVDATSEDQEILFKQDLTDEELLQEFGVLNRAEYSYGP